MPFEIANNRIFTKPKTNIVSDSSKTQDTTNIMDDVYSSYYESALENVRAVYIGLKDNCPEIITEASSDVLNTAVDFIERICSATDKIVALKLKAINNTLDSLKNDARQISSVLESKRIAFRLEGYEYTISEDIPNMDYINLLVEDIRKDLYDFNFSIARTNQFRDKIIYSDYFDRVRAKIIKHKKPIESGDFVDTIIPKFRNGESSPIELVVDNDYIKDMLEYIPKLQKCLKMAIKQKTDITDVMTKYKSLFKDGSNSWYAKHANGYKNSEHCTECSKALNDYCQLRSKECVTILNAVTLVYTEKFDAIKEATELYSYIFKNVLSLCNEVK